MEVWAHSRHPIAGKDGDAKVFCEHLLDSATTVIDANPTSHVNPSILLEDEIVDDDILDSLPFLEDETRDALSDILNGVEDHFEPIATPPTKILLYVEYEGNQIFKSTLVSQLNGNPFLSKDRLIRVKNSFCFYNNEAYLNATSLSFSIFLGLGSDAGVYFLEQRNTMISSTVKAVAKRKQGWPSKNGIATCVLNGVDEGTWWVGRVQKIRRKVGTKWGSSHQPVDLQNR